MKKDRNKPVLKILLLGVIEVLFLSGIITAFQHPKLTVMSVIVGIIPRIIIILFLAYMMYRIAKNEIKKQKNEENETTLHETP